MLESTARRNRTKTVCPETMPEEVARFRVGVDVGGTFTDIAVLDIERNELHVFKVPTVPADPAIGVIAGLDFAEREHPKDFQVRHLLDFLHGTTITTNALIERHHVPCALLVTAGLRGSVQVQDQSRQGNLFDLTLGHPDSLVEDRHVFEVPGRIDAAGKVVDALDEDAVRDVARRVVAAGLTSVTVCLLFAFLEPSHERRVREILLEEAPALRVALSSDVLPRVREWPRMSTVLASASLEPLLADYVGHLADELHGRELAFEQLFLMESNGGLMPFSAVLHGGRTIHTLLSGPAAAVQAAISLVRIVDRDQLITLDIGGTSADIAVVDETGALEVTEGRLAGHDIYVPMLDITTIGAGGGTISQVTPDGRLLVGPASAGADPGPACYGKGGTLPTTTDADLVLGLLNPSYYLGGRMPLDEALATAAIERHVATPLGIGVLEASEGMIRINDLHMADAIRVYAAQKGVDVRASTLVPCGGAGPLHAAGVARELGIRRFIVPPQPGVFSAVGLLCSDVVQDFVQSDITALLAENAGALEAQFAALEDRALAEFAAQGFAAASVVCRREVDARYAGQGFELRIPVDVPVGDDVIGAIIAAFHAAHEKTYGHAATNEGVEVVSTRIRALVELDKYRPTPVGAQRTLADQGAARGARQIYLGGTWLSASIVARTQLQPGDEVPGPAIVEQPDTTTLVPAGWTLRCDDFGNLDVAADD